VVVGVDGSVSSIDALRWAARHAQALGGYVHAVSAFDGPEGSSPDARALAERLLDARLSLGRAVVRTLGARPPVDVEAEAVRGPAVPVLLEAAHDAEVVVLGHRGRGGFHGLPVGSVGQHLCCHAPCSVVIVRS
jgi:nucleotide-binding universal stress UspA family protein